VPVSAFPGENEGHPDMHINKRGKRVPPYKGDFQKQKQSEAGVYFYQKDLSGLFWA